MALTTAQKFKIRDGAGILAINAPADYKKALGALPAGAKIISSGELFDQVHWFVRDKAQMKRELPKQLSLIKNSVICWLFFPKSTSKIQTDLTRDSALDALMKEDLQFLSLVSFDDTWSAFGVRQ